MDPRQLYVEHLDTITRIAESLCRRNGVQGADAEDFASDVKLKLLQDDYAVLRKYRGASSPTTFLTVVISHQFQDYRIRMWGKWRPSSEARRRGEVAVRLETAICRDNLSFEEACARIERDPRFTVTRAELQKIRRELPHRTPRRVDDGASVDELPASDSADSDVLGREREQRMQAAKEALRRAVSRLDPEDRVVIQMHYFEGFSVAEIARALHVEQKPLYPRLKRLLARLCAELTSEGIGSEYLQWLDPDPP